MQKNYQSALLVRVYLAIGVLLSITQFHAFLLLALLLVLIWVISKPFLQFSKGPKALALIVRVCIYNVAHPVLHPLLPLTSVLAAI